MESSDPYLGRYVIIRDTLYFDSSKTSLSYLKALGKLFRVQRLGEESEWLG